MFQTDPYGSMPPVKKENAFQEWYNKFASQPHQPFFFNGLVFLALFIFIVFLSYSQMVDLKVSLNIFHVYALVFVVFAQFFLGFLFVVFPRFLMQAEITKDVYMNHFKFYFVGTVLFFISIFVSEYLSIVAALILLCAQVLSFKILYAIHNKSLMKEKYDTKWILISFLTGIISHAFFIISMFDFSYNMIIQTASLNAGFYLFIFTLIFTISQRMIPFFTSMKTPGYAINKSKNLMEIIFSLLIIKVAILTLQKPEFNFLADVPLFIIFMREFIKWKLPMTKAIPIMWVLYISVYWIPVGFLLSSIESISYLMGSSIIFEKAVIHVFAIGYFITILFGFGTRVVLGHSGRTPTADNLTIALFIMVQFIVILRVFTSFVINFNMDYVFWINTSSLCLLAILFVWSVKYLPILIKLK